MYRAYENPLKLEDMYMDAKQRYEQMKKQGCSIEDLMQMKDEVEELDARRRFAWEDEESDMYDA